MKPYNKSRNTMNTRLGQRQLRRQARIMDLTFDVQTMLQPGKMMEIADDVLNWE
jgi:hypothetical protein